MIRDRIIAELERFGGTYDDPAIFGLPPGDPGLCGPGSMSWRLHSDAASVTIAGIGAIVLEILHPSVMAGVQDRSTYRTDPWRRSRMTTGYVITTTFANTAAAKALIGRVRRMHSRVNGTTPAGDAYRALDPELLAWVHTCIPWAILRAYERYNQPLTPAERDRYLAEQAVIGRLGGAENVPETMAELQRFVADIRPRLAVTEQTRAFFDFLLDNPFAPPLPDPVRRRYLEFQVHAGMSLMPHWARELSGFSHSAAAQRLVYEPHLRMTARALRWATGVPPYRRLAEQRTATRVLVAA
jgi:uncharacterized protein (DUF2236 family)